MSHDLLMNEWNDIRLVETKEDASKDSISLGLLSPVTNDNNKNEETSLGKTKARTVHFNSDTKSANQIKTFNASEASKLLEISSDSTSESDLNLQVAAPKRKVRFKRKFRPIARNKSKMTSQDAPSCPTCRCTDSLGIFASISMAISVIVVIWFQYNLRSQVNDLQKQYTSLEAQSKETPEALHDYHIQLKSLEFNVTSFADELKKLSNEISSISEEFKQYKATTDSLKESIAAAPEMKSLPKDVMTVSQTTAALGSKITLLENLVNDLKTEHASLKESSENIIKDHEAIKANVTDLVTKSKLQEVSPRSNQETDQAFRDSIMAYVHNEVLKVDESVDELNSTVTLRLNTLSTSVESIHDLNDSVVLVMDDLKNLHSYVDNNLSSSQKSFGSPDVLIDEALQNKVSAALNSNNNKDGSWQHLLYEAAQMSILYQDISQKLSSPISPAVKAENASVTTDRLFNFITQNCVQDIQSLNQSLVALAAKQESFQASTNKSILALAAETDENTKQLAEIQQGLNPAAAPAQAKSDPQSTSQLNQKKSIVNPSLGSGRERREEQPFVGSNPVPPRSKLLDTLRSSRSASNPTGEMLT